MEQAPFGGHWPSLKQAAPSRLQWPAVAGQSLVLWQVAAVSLHAPTLGQSALTRHWCDVRTEHVPSCGGQFASTVHAA